LNKEEEAEELGRGEGIKHDYSGKTGRKGMEIKTEKSAISF